MDWTAIWLSVRLAASTTLVLLAIGVPLAYWIVFSPRRWKFLVEAVVALPLVLPPTVLGFYVLVGDRPAEPGRPRVRARRRPRLAVHVRRAADCVGALLAAVRGAAVRGGVRVGRSPAARGVVVARRLAARHLPARRDSALGPRPGHRHRPQLRAHARRVRRRADGRRQSAWRHAHGVDLDLRQRCSRSTTPRPRGPRCCC